VVFEQVPKGGTSVQRGTKVLLYLNPEAKYANQKTDKVVVPDLQGFTPEQCETILGQLGLRMQGSGSGVAANQSPAPGKLIDFGGTVTVTFR